MAPFVVEPTIVLRLPRPHRVNAQSGAGGALTRYRDRVAATTYLFVPGDRWLESHRAMVRDGFTRTEAERAGARRILGE